MGTAVLTQDTNKRAIALDLKQENDREVMQQLVASADVFVENYRPGAFEALGLGPEAVAAINPRLVYGSISAFGQRGPRGPQTAYDHVIQATSGMMAMTGTNEANPMKLGSPAIDYATGITGAFALAAALFQRERTGRGQRIDLAMLDVAMILMRSHLTGCHAHRQGAGAARQRPGAYATNSAYGTKDGALVMLGASNLRQQRRLWAAVGRPEMAKGDNEEGGARTARRGSGRAARDHAHAHRRRMGGILASAPRPGGSGADHRGGDGRPADRRPWHHPPP